MRFEHHFRFLILFSSLTLSAVGQQLQLNISNSQSARAPKIERSTYFKQDYRLGFKTKLICIATGTPRPTIRWFRRDGVKLRLKWNLHLEEVMIYPDAVKSKVEIDPATVGDEGDYKCTASNRYGADHREFETEYHLSS